MGAVAAGPGAPSPVTFFPTPCLIVAVSGRALAASALRGGRRAAVLDCFADRDTRSLASACRSVVSSRGIRFDENALLRAARALAPPPAALVYGSGFEGRAGLLARLARGRQLYGNAPEVVERVRDPARFFPLLDRLGIASPEVRLDRPGRADGWLVKRPGGAGGAHVRHAAASRRPADAYYQRFEPGRTLSVLFLADGERALILGANRQWTAAARLDRPFLYGGAVGGVSLPRAVDRDIHRRLDALVAATGLVGLNGLDFILQGNRWLALELNPRPTATMELYDPDYPRGLFGWHLRACRGRLPAGPAAPRARRAHAVVFAAAPGRAAGLKFPGWCRDVPMPGVRFGRGDPLCTIHAVARTGVDALALLRRRHARIERMLRTTA
jgi:predicted ATP-grasp superfamily ATP-dependent carboligase